FGYGYLSNKGKGFSVKAGEALHVYFTPLQALEDLYTLDEERLSKAHLLAVFSEGERAERFHAQAYLRLDLVQEALDKKEYSKAWAQAIQGWGSELHAYRFTLSMTMDSIITMTFYVTLLIPFTLLLERMVSSSHGLRRLINILVIFTAALLPIFLLHPGTSLASNPPMIVLGLVILFLSAPVAAIFFLKFSEYLTQIQTRLRGAHFAAISRLALALISLDVGVSQMKKRPLRTTLTLITVTLVVFSLVTLTSSQYYAEAFPVEIIHNAQTPYNGLLITQGGYDVLPNLFLEYLKATYSENFSICPRTWIYPPFGTVTFPLRFPVFKGENESGVISLMGLVPEEEADPIFQLALESGSRWFTTYDTFTCIIPTPLAQKIGAQIGDTIKVWGYNFTVIGIFTPEILDGQKDLSQMPATPLDPYVTQQVQGVVTGQRIPANELILIPFNTARKLGGGVNQIALIASQHVEEDTLRQMGQDLAYQIPALFVFTGHESEVRLYRLRFVLTTRGYELLTFPVVVAMLVLLTTMLGIVQERQKDIFTYGSLGISPMNMSLMFLCESTTFAIVGATFGYIAGTGFLILGQKILNLPAQSLALNYSSRFVLLSVTLAILGTIGASLYPLFVAGRLVTPSLERKWKIAKPYGDKWTIILPFQADYKETLGVLAYLKEYLEGIRMEARSQQKFAIESLTYEEREETKALVMTV
ncbi:MAG: ABC transporter permease, partial [Candidatus Bathyarchaeia archaeon]